MDRRLTIIESIITYNNRWKIRKR